MKNEKFSTNRNAKVKKCRKKKSADYDNIKIAFLRAETIISISSLVL